MKKSFIIAALVLTAFTVISCGGPRREPGRAYMPDMAKSRAYETYADHSALDSAGVHYTAQPVTGTIARGDMTLIYPYKNDSAGYANSATVMNPLKGDSMTAAEMTEAKRLYLVNCGICHGTKLDGNGPLWNDGNGPFPSKPINLKTDPKYISMADGTMFHSITYGRNAMGSYASQVTTKQRWQIINYIRSEQKAGGAAAAPAAADTMKAAAPATTAKTMK